MFGLIRKRQAGSASVLGNKRRQIINAPFFQLRWSSHKPIMFFSTDNALRAAFVGDIGGQRLVSGVGHLLKTHQRRCLKTGKRYVYLPAEAIAALAVSWQRRLYHRNTVAPARPNPVADNIAGVRGDRTNSFRAGPRQRGIVPVIGIDIDQLGGRSVGVFQFISPVRR